MGRSTQAKILTPKQKTTILTSLQTTRYTERDRAMFLLSIKAGLRAQEIASVTWSVEASRRRLPPRSARHGTTHRHAHAAWRARGSRAA